MKTIVDALVQVGLVVGISYLIYLVSKRRVKGFMTWIGLKLPNNPTQRKKILMLLGISIGLAGLPIGLLLMAGESGDLNMAYESVRGDHPVWLALIFKSMIQTALSEEILFRGLFAKRLINWLGYKKGNLIQALVFGLIHSFAILTYGWSLGVILVLMIGITAYFYGYIMECLAKGSIFYGWLIHGLTNLMAFTLFYLIQ